MAHMRKSDAFAVEHEVSSRELMRRAGEAVVRATEAELGGFQAHRRIAVVCGSGNNAGDGYVIAHLLHERGADVRIFPVSDRFSEDGAFYFGRCLESGVRCEPAPAVLSPSSLIGYDLVFDCLLGTGFRGEPRGEVAAAVRAVNDSGAYVVSVDINSGLNGDSGLCTCAVRSDFTVSVGAWKPGHFLNMAKDFMRRKVSCDIGIRPVERSFYYLDADDFRGAFLPRRHFSNKSAYGYLSLIGGSLSYSGAIRLASLAAASMRCGAGVVRIALPRSVASLVIPHILESTLYPLADASEREGEVHFVEEEIRPLLQKSKAIGFGMGIGTSNGAEQILRYCLRHYEGILIVDADGLNLLAHFEAEMLRNKRPRLVLTPHVLEISRLLHCSTEEVLADPILAAERLSLWAGGTVLLKGPATVVTDGRLTYLVDAGCPGMATAGSGDVLSGILSALCANEAGFASPCDTPVGIAALAAYINGRAGERAQAKQGEVSMIAGDTVAEIPHIIRELA